MYLVRLNQSCVCDRNSRYCTDLHNTHEEGGEGAGACEFVLKYVQIVHFYAFFNHFYGTFFPYIAHERTAQNLDFVSSLVALNLIERHRSQN